MRRSKTSDTEQVIEYINRLDHKISEAVLRIREIILSTDPSISEHIKWNSPCFYYNGEIAPFDPKEYKRDIVVLNLHRGRLMLVFPTGASIYDTAGFLEGSFTDGRRVINFKDKTDIEAKVDDLKRVIRAWLSNVDRG